MVDAETQTYTSLSEDAHYMVRVIFMVTFRNFLLNGMLKYKAFAPLFTITESGILFTVTNNFYCVAIHSKIRDINDRDWQLRH